MPTYEDNAICELCGIKVIKGDRVARVISEVCISDGGHGGAIVEGDPEIVFAVFHHDCVIKTYASRECDVVAYLSEARELILDKEEI